MIEGGHKVRVLIADDSAFMRKVLQSILATDPQLDVIGEARDGREAVSLNDSLNPDVISMDIMMPHVDGLQATEQIMSRNPRPIVIVSSEARDGAEATLRALELGAIDFVPKPSSGIDLDMNSMRDEICRKLKMASRVRVVRNALNLRAEHSRGTLSNSPYAKQAPHNGNGNDNGNGTHAPSSNGLRHPLVIMAASTGGPQALM